MTEYQISLKRIKLKVSSQGPSWFPEKIREKLKNRIYWCSIVWDQPILSKSEGPNKQNQINLKEAIEGFSDNIKNKIRVSLPCDIKGFINEYYLWANQEDIEPSNGINKPNIINFSRYGYELWRGTIEGTLNYKIWIFESNSEQRKYGEIISKIFKSLTTDTIFEFANEYVNKWSIEPYTAIIYSIGSIVGKILKDKEDDLVSVYEGSRMSSNFPEIGQNEAETLSSYKTDILLNFYTQIPESMESQFKKIIYDESHLNQFLINEIKETPIDLYSVNELEPPIGIDVPITKGNFYENLSDALDFIKSYQE